MSKDAKEEEESVIAFESIQALPGLCRLYKRSSTLDGRIQLRAAQHCSPVIEGVAAGFQIFLEKPMTLWRDADGIQIDMTPPAFKQSQEEAPERVEQLVKDGLIERNGYWHRLLRRGALPIQGARVRLWSGFLVRPAAGVCLRVGSAFNRRSRITVVDYAIVDGSGFTPLMLEIDGRSLGPEPTWIHEEIGCVLPIAPQVSLTLHPVAHAPEVVRAFEEFFDAHYFGTKQTRPTAKYRRLLSDPETPAETCEAQVIYAGPSGHSISYLERFHGPSGIGKSAPEGVSLPQCLIRNIAPINAAWDGQMMTREDKEFASALPALERDWIASGGELATEAFKFFSGYFYGQSRDEPLWQLQAWVFAITPPGWSTVVDGVSVAGCDGMRGIIRTDQFFPISNVYRMYAPGPVVIPRRAPLMHIYPLPRRLQNAKMRELPPPA